MNSSRDYSLILEAQTAALLHRGKIGHGASLRRCVRDATRGRTLLAGAWPNSSTRPPRVICDPMHMCTEVTKWSGSRCATLN